MILTEDMIKNLPVITEEEEKTITTMSRSLKKTLRRFLKNLIMR